jgi:tRNA (guanine-N7-)-methyltransferase
MVLLSMVVVGRRYAVHSYIMATKRSMVLSSNKDRTTIVRLSSTVATANTPTAAEQGTEEFDDDEDEASPPWTNPSIRLKTNPRFRQHVNPLASKYQQPALLPPDWPTSIYADCDRPLHVDIGCGKGGYLYKLSKLDDTYNYLGLELRPTVATFAKQRYLRVDNRNNSTLTDPPQQQPRPLGSLDYVGCNANVDLGRILSLYRPGILERVTIQFPDPHFKVLIRRRYADDCCFVLLPHTVFHHQSKHAKRRVVTDDLIRHLAQSNMPEGGLIFLQSDVKGAFLLAELCRTFMKISHHYHHHIDLRSCSPEALDYMRFKFDENAYFTDELEGQPDEYIATNILGVATEREIHVLEKGLSVYRAVFRRNGRPFLASPPELMMIDGPSSPPPDVATPT